MDPRASAASCLTMACSDSSLSTCLQYGMTACAFVKQLGMWCSYKVRNCSLVERLHPCKCLHLNGVCDVSPHARRCKKSDAAANVNNVHQGNTRWAHCLFALKCHGDLCVTQLAGMCTPLACMHSFMPLLTLHQVGITHVVHHAQGR